MSWNVLLGLESPGNTLDDGQLQELTVREAENSRRNKPALSAPALDVEVPQLRQQKLHWPPKYAENKGQQRLCSKRL